MKLIFSLFLLFSFNINAQKSGPDILLASNLDREWSHHFTRQIRQFLKNVDINDPLFTQLDKDIELYNGTIEDLGSFDSSDRDFIGNLTGLDLSQSRVNIIIKKLGFNFLDLKANLLKKGQDLNGNLIWTGDFTGQGLFINGDSLLFELQVFNNLHVPPIKILVENPRLRILEADALKFYTDISLINNKKQTKAKFYNADFSRTTAWLEKSKNRIELEYDQITTSNIQVSIGSKQIVFNNNDLKQIVTSRLKQIKSLLIDIAIEQLNNGMGLILLKQIEDYYYDNNQWIETDSLVFSWDLDQITSIESSDGIQFNFKSDFCLPKDFDLIVKTCLEKYPLIPTFKYPENSYQKSRVNIDHLLKSNQSNLVMSVSENYLNRLLGRTVQAGYWEDALIENDLKLGPMGVFSRLDNPNEISVYIDMIYSAKKFVKTVLGTDEIRFPVKILMDFRIEDRAGESVFIIQIKNFDISKESLIKGYKELSLASSIEDQKRLKGVTAKKILKKLEPYIGTDIFLLPVPSLNQLNLEKALFKSDGYGRINTLIKYN